MVQNGQEFGEDHFVPEHDHDSGRRVIPRPLRWKLHDDPVGRALRHLYGRPANRRRDHPALRSPHIRPQEQPGWQTRLNGGVENFVIALNFSDADQWVSIPFPLDDDWADVLNDEPAVVRGLRLETTVASDWGRILRRAAG